MKYILYAGSYTHDNENDDLPTGSQGIYRFEFDSESGRIRFMDSVMVENPSFLATDRAYLYAVSELMHRDSIHAISINDQNGKMNQRRSLALNDDWACHLAIHPNGKWAVVSHYWNGALTLVELDSNGNIVRTAMDIRHHPASYLDERISRVHSAAFSADGRYLYCADLGLNRFYIYELDEKTGWIYPNRVQPFLQLGKKEKPRHFALHEDGLHIYLLTESDSQILVLERNVVDGSLRKIQQLSTLPVGYNGRNMAADIHISANGKYLYISNRGHNSIACFEITKNANLILVGHEDCGGKWPRNFCLDKESKWIVIANQFSNEFVVKQINPITGMPMRCTDRYQIPAVSCVVFL